MPSGLDILAASFTPPRPLDNGGDGDGESESESDDGAATDLDADAAGSSGAESEVSHANSILIRQTTCKGRYGGDSDVESLGDRSDYTYPSDDDDDDDPRYIASGSDEDTIGVMSEGS